VAALDRIRHPRGEQEGTPRVWPLCCWSISRTSRMKLVRCSAILPLPARRQVGRVPEEVEMHAVEVILLDNFADHRQTVVAHLLDRVIPKALPPPRADQPLGMRGLHRIAFLQLGVDTRFVGGQIAALDLVHPQPPPNLLAAPVALLDQLVEVVDPRLAPFHQPRMPDRAENRAAVVSHAFVRDVDTDCVELAIGHINEIEDVPHDRIQVRAKASLLLDIRCRIVLEEDAPLPVHRGLMLGRLRHTPGRPSGW
jgi:hypothetical protein